VSNQNSTSQYVACCELCKGNGIIPVRFINGARSMVQVTKAGFDETVAYKETGFVRCRCTRGERYQKNFGLFDHKFCVSQYPGGEEVAAEMGHEVKQQQIPF
jgi:hypothetical protein